MRVQLQWDSGEDGEREDEKEKELKEMMNEWDEYSSYYRDKDPESLEKYFLFSFLLFFFINIYLVLGGWRIMWRGKARRKKKWRK